MLQKNINTYISKFKYGITFFLCAFFVLNFMSVPSARAAAPSDLHRFWSDAKQAHFYTASEDEKNQVIANDASWKYEGVAYQVLTTPEAGTVPVYRFWSDTKQGHFYTSSEDEKNQIDANYPDDVWRLEGLAWYAYNSTQPDSAPVYRFWSEEKQHHFFTFNPSEKTCVQNSYSESTWRYEGIAYWTPGVAPPDNPDATCGASLGPLISVGLWSVPRTDAKSTPFKIRANGPYEIKDSAGTLIAQIPADTITKIQYDTEERLMITDSVTDTVVGSEVTFTGLEGNNSAMIFDVFRPDSTLDQYRGQFKFRYSKASQKVWAINILPIEQYVWGMGEITGTGPMEYNKVMTTMFRTYGYWKIKYSTKHLSEGFIVDATPGDQIYKGYDYEMQYARISQAAKNTRGKIITYNGDAAITPFSSWTDGRTRSFQERWGSTDYPWCQSVEDPYGKNTTMTTDQLVAAGNHMVGLSAHGALNLAGTKYNWTWDQIVNYYFKAINITSIY